MKLFNAIAAAVLMGTSLTSTNPAKSYQRAPNGWVHIATATDGSMKHEKLDSFAQNRYANVQVASNRGAFPKTIDCVQWTHTFSDNGGGWSPVLPGTVGHSSAKYWCNR